MIKNLIRLTCALSFFIIVAGCFPEGFEEQANQKFGDQHFKTAIALIELHKVREGEYPESLDDLKHLGDWDQIVFVSVKYQKVGEGYQLDLTKGWNDKPQKLQYPDDFWKGLGLVKSNLKSGS